MGTFANSSDPDEIQQNVGPDPDLNSSTLMRGSRKFCQRGSKFENVFFFS